MGAESVRVLFVAGAGRSGSTLLAGILGEIDGWFNGGEIRYLWQRGLIEQRLCGCGEPVRACPLWSAVLERAFGQGGDAGAGRVPALQARTSRMRHLPLLLSPLGRRGRFAADVAAYTEHLAPLYTAIRDIARARVIVDSSKLPAFGAVLDRTPGIELSVVHLVRDARASAYSWLRPKALADRAASAYMERQGPVRTAALWTTWNAVAERLWRRGDHRYLFLRYEDFVAAPEAAVREVATLMGEPSAGLPFAAERTVRLGVNHSVAGNPDRLRQGDIALRADTEWRGAMRARDRRIVTAVAAPLLARYGYLRNRSSNSERSRRDSW